MKILEFIFINTFITISNSSISPASILFIEYKKWPNTHSLFFEYTFIYFEIMSTIQRKVNKQTKNNFLEKKTQIIKNTILFYIKVPLSKYLSAYRYIIFLCKLNKAVLAIVIFFSEIVTILVISFLHNFLFNDKFKTYDLNICFHVILFHASLLPFIWSSFLDIINDYHSSSYLPSSLFKIPIN